MLSFLRKLLSGESDDRVESNRPLPTTQDSLDNMDNAEKSTKRSLSGEQQSVSARKRKRKQHLTKASNVEDIALSSLNLNSQNNQD